MKCRLSRFGSHRIARIWTGSAALKDLSDLRASSSWKIPEAEAGSFRIKIQMETFRNKSSRIPIVCLCGNDIVLLNVSLEVQLNWRNPMKFGKISTVMSLVVILTLSLFTIGCGGSEPAKPTPPPPAAPAAPAAPAEPAAPAAPAAPAGAVSGATK